MVIELGSYPILSIVFGKKPLACKYLCVTFIHKRSCSMCVSYMLGWVCGYVWVCVCMWGWDGVCVCVSGVYFYEFNVHDSFF